MTVGSQKFQFNRLLKEIDKLVEEEKINEEVFAQIGYSNYKPKNYKYKEFLDRDKFTDVMSRCDKVITHGGTGAIISAVKRGKKVVVVPRLRDYGEHVDNHQFQIANEFEKANIIKVVKDIYELEYVLAKINQFEFMDYISNTENIIMDLKKFIEFS